MTDEELMEGLRQAAVALAELDADHDEVLREGRSEEARAETVSAPARLAWIIRRHRLGLVILLVLAIALASPAIGDALPNELRHILDMEYGPLALALAVIGAVDDTAGKEG